MPVTGAFPYDLDNLLGGRARVLLSDPSTALPAIPENITDLFDALHPYEPNTGWIDVGATTDATSYSRDMESEGYEIQQATGAVFEEITEVVRQLEVPFGEITPEFVQILEEGQDPEVVAAVTAESVAQQAVKFGSIESLTPRRVAFVGQRNKGSGLVNETETSPAATRERGRFVVCVLYNVTIAAEGSEVSVEKGELVSMPITFKAFPEDGEVSGEEYGTWLMEDAGTITFP